MGLGRSQLPGDGEDLQGHSTHQLLMPGESHRPDFLVKEASGGPVISQGDVSL